MTQNEIMTGFIWEEKYLEHDTGKSHPESIHRLKAVKEVVDSHQKLIWIPARSASDEEILAIHTKSHVEQVKLAKNQIGYFDGDTPYSLGSSEAAFLAAGGVIELVDHVYRGELKNGFAFPRPPGHHAESDRIMGFCLFNNVAIAAEYLIQTYDLKRIAIIDYDVHHGNGTQNSFYHRDDVFYISAHQYPFYPGTGSAQEDGIGKGKGFNLNIPLGIGASDDDIDRVFLEKIIPALDNYKPEFVIVSAGFDAHRLDPLGGLNFTQKAFFNMSQKLHDLAKIHCEGKIAFVLEGGYSLKGLKEGVEAVFDVIS